MTRFYLSGPMRGKPDLNRPMFENVATLLRNLGYTVATPFDKRIDDQPINALFLEDLKVICSPVDAVVALPGWDTSNGATAEVAVAVAIGVPVMEFEIAMASGEPLLRDMKP